MTKAIYKFYWDCGRMGDLNGLFIADKSNVLEAVGHEIDFGEVLGKHSDIYGKLEEKDLTLLSDDQAFVEKFESIMGEGTVSGHNPIERYQEQKEDGEYGCE